MQSDTDVLIVGAGPVGLFLAIELQRRGVDHVLIEQRPAPSYFVKALGISPRTLEIWEQIGIAREAIDAGLFLRGAGMLVNGELTTRVPVPEGKDQEGADEMDADSQLFVSYQDGAWVREDGDASFDGGPTARRPSARCGGTSRAVRCASDPPRGALARHGPHTADLRGRRADRRGPSRAGKARRRSGRDVR